jgi:hypothetical protein
MNAPSGACNSLVLSYLGLRKAVGYLGTALPFVLAFGGMLLDGPGIQGSISSYYYTGMRNVFVGTLCAIGVFMLSYRGYERKDDIAGDLACVFAVVVALFPTTPHGTPSAMDKLIGTIHLASAAAFFLTLSYFSLILFTKTDPNKQPTLRKIQRNKVYKACGYTMLAALALMVFRALLPTNIAAYLDKIDPVFWLESVAVIAFGVSWLTKGEAMLKDET